MNIGISGAEKILITNNKESSLIHYTKLKNTLLCLLAIAVLLFGLAGCNSLPATESAKPVEKPSLENSDYTSFENGLGTFYADYTSFKAYLTYELTKTSPEKDISDDEHAMYYNNFMLLMSLAELELSVLPEFDLLSVTQDYDNRAEGTLPVTEQYGYKIKQNQKLKFGYEGTDKTLTGVLNGERGLVTITVDDKIQENTGCKTVAEIVIADKDTFVMRYSKSISETSSTKTFCILMKDGHVIFTYYEGAAQLSSYISLDMLLDYNIDALVFGAGMQLSFDISL